jgi:peptide chain release factor 1
LSKAEDVVDEEEHVLALHVTEVLRHGETGEADPKPGAGRLVHLTIDQRDILQDLGFLELQVQVVPFAGALTHAAEHRPAAVTLGHVVDELLNDHGLPHPGAPEQADLAALDERGNQIDDFDPRFEDLGLGLQIGELRGGPVNRPPLSILRQRRTTVHRLTQDVEDSTQRSLANRSGDGSAGITYLHAPGNPVGGAHGNGPNLVLPDVLLHFGREFDRNCAAGILDLEGVIDLGQVLRLELHVEDRTDDLHHPPNVVFRGAGSGDLFGCYCCGHASMSLDLSVIVILSTAKDALSRPARLPRCPAYPCNAAAPPTISAISWVICACRWRL